MNSFFGRVKSLVDRMDRTLSNPTISLNIVDVLFLLVWVYFTYFLISKALTIPIQSDGVAHAQLARWIARTGELRFSFPGFLVDEVGHEFPISYPHFYHIVLALFWLLWGNNGIQLVGPISSSLMMIVLYYFTGKLVGKGVGLIAVSSLFLTRFNFVITVQVFPESLLNLFLAISIMCYFMFVKESSRKYLYVSAIALGFALTIKPTAAALGATILIFELFRYLKSRKEYKSTFLRNLKAFIGITCLVSAPLLIYFFSNPGVSGSMLMFITAGKYGVPPEVSLILTKAYLPWNVNIENYLITMNLFSNIGEFEGWYFLISSVLSIIGVVALAIRKETRPMVSIIAIVLLISTVMYFIMLAEDKRRYFSYNLFLISILVGSGFLAPLKAIKKLSGRVRFKYCSVVRVGSILTCIFLLGLLGSPMISELLVQEMNYPPSQDQRWINSIIETSEWLALHKTNQDLVISTRCHEITYYSDGVKGAWIDVFGGRVIDKIRSPNSTARISLEVLQRYNATYYATAYGTFNTYGTTTILDGSTNFKRVKSTEYMDLYQIRYYDAPSPAFDRRYYSRVFSGNDGDYLDMRLIYLTPSFRFEVQDSAPTLKAGSTGYMTMFVYPDDFKCRSNGCEAVFFLTYRDFYGKVDISIRETYENGDWVFHKIGTIQGTGTEGPKTMILRLNLTEPNFLPHEWRKLPFLVFTFSTTADFTIYATALYPGPYDSAQVSLILNEYLQAMETDRAWTD